MGYPNVPNFNKLSEQLTLYSQLQHEYGAQNIEPILAHAEQALQTALAALKALPVDAALAQQEPDDLATLHALRPAGPRQMWKQLDPALYPDKLAGALLGRMAGNVLGAPVEFWPIERMEALAKETASPYPPQDYWTYVPDPYDLRYQLSPREDYTRHKLNGVPVDDDLAYTLLGLLIVEDFGPNFTTDDVGQAWLKYLPYAATAEDVALRNLKAGIPAAQVGITENPFREWIGADIRSDPWAYMAPGWPEQAAAMAYHDAYISHRRQGIYGEMFFAAAISAAFTVKHPLEALEIGLTEIPRDCALARAVRWAIDIAPQIHTYRQARDTMEEHFKGMSGVHTINNACLTIWGLSIGGTDFSHVISETVAMGLDNDCTAATAGSIVGAIVGKAGIPERWYRNFNDTVHSYLIGQPRFAISDLLRRFNATATRIFAEAKAG